jgi:integrase
LLARLGLRAGDIVQLRLGDLDWREGMICVSGKGRRQAVLPLNQEVGDALATYIKGHRPQAFPTSRLIGNDRLGIVQRYP